MATDSTQSTKPLSFYMIWFVVIWGVIAGGVYFYIGKDEPNALWGVLGAALLSLILLLKTYMEAWEGEIVEIKNERVFVRGNNDQDGYWKDELISYLRLTNGKTKKMNAPLTWTVGMKLKKTRGDMQMRIVE